MNILLAIQYFLIIILIAYAIYFAIAYYKETRRYPEMWKSLFKEGKLSPELIKIMRNYKDKERFFNFWFQTERLKKDNVKGSFAELGVYKGNSAYILHKLDKGRTFHLFDTFTGFTGKDLSIEVGEAAHYTKHNFADTSLERVKQKLNNDNFIFHKGYFPQTTNMVENEKFALVNIDADLYNPTKAGLEFFYPRLSYGGVIIVHDYNPKWPGIIKAVNDFARTIPEPIIQLTDKDSSVMIFKVKKG